MNDSSKNLENNQAWYKYPMVWLVIGLPFIAVVASLATVVIAHKNAPIVIEHNESYKSVLNNKNTSKKTHKDSNND
jgi:hypothetical protein